MLFDMHIEIILSNTWKEEFIENLGMGENIKGSNREKGVLRLIQKAHHFESNLNKQGYRNKTSTLILPKSCPKVQNS